MATTRTDSKALWWTTVTVTLTMTIFGQLTRLVERNVNSEAYLNLQTFFRASQPDYFSLLYLLVMFIAVLPVVWVYRWVRPHLPAHWIVSGLIVGIFIFLVADLVDAVSSVYTTVIPAAAVRGMTFAALVNKLVNGCVLTYVYRRFSKTTVESAIT
jgi:hypothetical protein